MPKIDDLTWSEFVDLGRGNMIHWLSNARVAQMQEVLVSHAIDGLEDEKVSNLVEIIAECEKNGTRTFRRWTKRACRKELRTLYKEANQNDQSTD